MTEKSGKRIPSAVTSVPEGEGDLSPFPFDAIRCVDETHTQYGSARDRNRLLGYRRGQRAEGGIARAKAACVEERESITHHFNARVKSSHMIPDGVSERVAYPFTRLVAYRVAHKGNLRGSLDGVST